MSGTKKLVIVESPTKMKSIAQYLGDGYEVLASVGHIRDLIEPKNLPAELKKGSLGKFSVDVDNGFEPYYVVSDAKKKTVAELKRALKDADELLLATDEDREGEAIAWHLLQELKPKVPVRRMVFHEITKDAIQQAKDNTRELDTALVDAQETRRILDRLYGYEVSPVLWRKVGPGPLRRPRAVGRDPARGRPRARAPRVRRRRLLGPRSDASPRRGATPRSFDARLVRLDGERVATRPRLRRPRPAEGRRRSCSTRPPPRRSPRRSRADGVDASGLEGRVEAVLAPPGRAVHHVDAAAGGRPQAPPLGAQHTMSVAQSLYENGLHHLYAHRLAVAVAAGDQRRPRRRPSTLYGADDRPRQAPRLRRQEQERAGGARGDPPVGRDVPHAVRAVERAPRQRVQALRPHLEAHGRLADGRRQGPDRHGHARGRSDAPMPRRPRTHRAVAGTIAEFTASRHRHHLPRLPRRLRGGPRRGAQRRRRAGRGQAAAADGGPVPRARRARGEGPRDQPAAALHRGEPREALEELGIGRPSTFASIISTILDRGYVTHARPGARARAGSRSRSCGCSRSTSPTSSSTTSPPRWRTTSTASPRGEADRVDWLNGFYFGSETSTAASARSSTTSATSTRARSTRCGSRTTSRCASASTGPTSRSPRGARPEPRRAA